VLEDSGEGSILKSMTERERHKLPRFRALLRR
jgi:hypothetical protein